LRTKPDIAEQTAFDEGKILTKGIFTKENFICNRLQFYVSTLHATGKTNKFASAKNLASRES